MVDEPVKWTCFKGEYKQTIKQKLLNLYISIR